MISALLEGPETSVNNNTFFRFGATHVNNAILEIDIGFLEAISLVVVDDPKVESSERPIRGLSAACGYEVNWALNRPSIRFHPAQS
jgi:hypothetical protein